MSNLLKILSVIYHFLLTENMRQIRLDVFIGLSALTIAVAVFIPQMLIKNEEAEEIANEAIVTRTSLKWIYRLTIIIFAMLWAEEICARYKIWYIIYQFILNVLIIINAYLTINSILITIKIIVNEKYKDEIVYKYCKKLMKNKNNIFDNKKALDKEKEIFDNFLRNNNIVKMIDDDFIYTKEYEAIKSTKRGLLKDYRIGVLKRLCAKNSKKVSYDKEDVEENNNTDYPIILTKRIGEYINKNDVIGYYNNEIIKDGNNIINSFVLSDSIEYDTNTIKKINKHYFAIASKNEDGFDDNNYLHDYINKLFKTRNDKAINLFVEDIYQLYRKNDILVDETSFVRFIESIIIEAFENGYEKTYYQLLDIVNYHYTDLIIKSDIDNYDDFEEKVYLYNSFYTCIYYAIDRSPKYYEKLLFMLLNTIYDLLREEKIKAISKIIDSNFIRKTVKNDATSYLDRQFVCSIVYALSLITKYEYEKFKKNNDDYTEIIDKLSEYDYGIYTINEFISDYYYIIHNNNSIIQLKERTDFKIFDHKYQEVWSSRHIDDGELLINVISIYHLMFIKKDLIDNNELNNEYEYLYMQIKESIKDYDNNDFINSFNIVYDINKISEHVELVLNAFVEQEKENRRSTIINNDELNEIRYAIRDVLCFESPFIRKTKQLNKIQLSERKTKEGAYINHLISKDFLLGKYSNGKQALIDGYKSNVSNFIFNKYVKKLDNLSSKHKINIDDYIKEIENHKDYLLFLKDYNEISKFNDDYSMVRNNYFVSDEISESFAIRIDELPVVELCLPEEVEENYVIDRVYIKLIDLSSSEDERNRIINSKFDFKNIQDDSAKHNYLKENLLLKVFYPFGVK